MIVELLSLVDTLSKIKDLKDLLVQERLEIMISFLRTLGEVQMRTAIEELEAVKYSTRPEDERSRTIGHLKVAANALSISLEQKSFLKRLAGSRRRDRTRHMETYLQITGCYLVVASLYLTQRNMQLARQYAVKASEAFEAYAHIRRDRIRSLLFSLYTYNGGTDQAPLVCFIDNKELRTLMARYGVQGPVYEGTLHELATKIVEAERERLFDWLGPLGKT